MSRRFAAILLLAGLSVLVWSVVHLFYLRFAEGDVYSEYSTLRSDPLGTMVLFESLERIPGLTVQRALSASTEPPEGRSTAYLLAGTSIEMWKSMPKPAMDELKEFLNSGGRLIVTFNSGRPAAPEPVEPEDDSRTEESDDKPPAYESWGMEPRLDLRSPLQGEDAVAQNSASDSLPASLYWPGPIVFNAFDAEWRPVYVRESAPVMMERTFGRGIMIVASDSYFLSNEAMAMDREPELLAWLIGESRTVIFDEAHLGTSETPGVANLIRRYRLQWFVAGLVVLAGLFVWMMSTSLVPRQLDAEVLDHVEGRDAASGLVNLLRRSIPAGELMSVCWHEWRRSAPQVFGSSAAKLAQAEQFLQSEGSPASKAGDPVRIYVTISEILGKKTR